MPDKINTFLPSCWAVELLHELILHFRWTLSQKKKGEIRGRSRAIPTRKKKREKPNWHAKQAAFNTIYTNLSAAVVELQNEPQNTREQWSLEDKVVIQFNYFLKTSSKKSLADNLWSLALLFLKIYAIKL